jgi:tellurite resistance protein
MTMNAKFLFAATVAVSALATFASTTVLADEINAPLNRAQVTAQLEQARANGTLQKTDYDFGVASRSESPSLSRSEVLATPKS